MIMPIVISLPGSIGGIPFSLTLRNIRTELLVSEIARINTIELETGERDNDVQVFIQAAKELIAGGWGLLCELCHVIMCL